MRPGRRRVAGIAAVGVVVAAVLVPRGAGSAGTAAAVTTTTTTVATVATAAQAPAARGQRSTVTLITGDTVTMDGSDRIDVRRGEGRERVRFVVEHHRGHTHVIPVDALPLLRADKLDKRLFDVTALVRYGYDDRRADLPLIVAQPAGAAGARGRARPAVPAGVRVRRDLPGAGAVAARADRKDTAVWRAIKDRGTGAAVPKVWLDAKSRITLDVSVPSIGAPSAWRAGLTGEGVTVAVADTGVDGGHPDLAGKVAASRSFVSETDERDLHGHGTHVASTVAGSGAASGGRNSGVAPGARLVAAKVCDQFGFCPESAVIEGIQWAVEEQGADVVNLSLGGPDTPDLDPEEQAIERLTEQHGTLFVVAAGNSGAARTVDSPGSADAALTVGATDDGAALAPFSSQGPRVGDSALKPDITAPGVAIAAARGRDAADDSDEEYVTLSGTSMATPHVAGAAAILKQKHPDWTAPRLKAALMGTAVPDPRTGVYAQGAGRVDVARAVAQTVLADPSGVSFGLQRWPHDDDAAQRRTVTYRNTGGADVTLDLSLDATGPAGMFALSADRLTVPAGGTAAVTLTGDTTVAGPDGPAGGHLVARGGGTEVRTPFAVEKEVESYDATLTHVDRDGRPADDYATYLINLDTGHNEVVYAGAGATMRLPRGRYLVQSILWDVAPDDEERLVSTHLLAPVVDLTRDRAVTLDARIGRPVSAALPRRGARQVSGDIFHGVGTPIGDYAWGEVFGSFADLFVGAADRRTTVDGLVTRFGGKWVDPSAAAAYEYNLAWAVRGRAPHGFHRVVLDRDLAEVRATYLPHLPDATGLRFARARFADLPFGSITDQGRFGLPARRTEYYSVAPDLTWDIAFEEEGPAGAGEPAWTQTVEYGVRHRRARAVDQTWNGAVYGPAFPVGAYDPARPDGVAVRYGDDLYLQAPLFGDGAGRAGVGSAPGRLRLSRDGEVIGEQGLDAGAPFPVPAERGRYRLEATARRDAPYALSTEVACVWEFTSAHVGDQDIRPLALSTVLFAPKLDRRHSAPAGRAFTVPVTVRAQEGPDAAANARLAVRVSYDDGRTWAAVPVRRGVMTLRHPPGAGFVSLRAEATDTAGNTVEQTIIRAYRFG